MLFLANGEPFNGQPVSLCSFLPLQPPTAVSQESLKGLTASVHRTAQTLYPIPAIAACEIVSASRSMFPEFIPQTRTNHLSHGLSNAGSLPGCAKASSTKSVASDCMTFICFLNDQVLALAIASGQSPSSTPTPHQLLVRRLRALCDTLDRTRYQVRDLRHSDILLCSSNMHRSST